LIRIPIVKGGENMIITMHGLSTMHCNIKSEIRIASEIGFQGLEIVETKLLRYLDLGLKLEELALLLNDNNVKAVCINALKNVETIDPERRKRLLEDAEKLCKAAEVLKCPTVQLVPFNELEGRSLEEIMELTAKNIADIADIGKQYGVRFQLEPIAFSPIHSLSQSLELIKLAGKDNVGMVIDFWHLWAGEETVPQEVAALNKSMIYGVHFCDGRRHIKGTKWDEAELRAFLPGEGDIPIEEWVNAVLSTGYDGSWSSELYSPRHWEWDIVDIAKETKARMEKYLKKSMQGIKTFNNATSSTIGFGSPVSS